MEKFGKMYSWEIKQLIELKNYLLLSEEYLYILNTSPQICRCSYDNYNDEFRIVTDDRLDIKFKVKKKERGN